MKTKTICTTSRNKSSIISSKIFNSVRRFGVKSLLLGTAVFVLYGVYVVKGASKTPNPALKEHMFKTENSYPPFEEVITQALIRSNTRDQIVQKVDWILANVVPSEIYYATPGESTATTQAGIDSHSVIYFTPGLYNNFSSINDCYSLKPNKINIFDGAILHGLGPEHWYNFEITNGGPVIVLGINGSRAENFKRIFGVGESQYNGLLIEGLNGSFYDYGIRMNNIKGSVPFTAAPLVLNLSELIGEEGAKKALAFYSLGQTVDETTPYAGGYNLVLRNIKCDAAIFDVPIYYKQIGGGALDDGEWTALGNDEISDIVTDGCSSFSLPDNVWIYNSPKDLAQKDLAVGATALVTGEIYYDWDDNPHIFDGENCFEAGPKDLYKDANGKLYAVMFGGAHKPDKSYIADLEPIATMDSVAYFIDCYLSEPNDLNYDQRANFNSDLIINLKDYAEVAEKHLNEGE